MEPDTTPEGMACRRLVNTRSKCHVPCRPLCTERERYLPPSYDASAALNAAACDARAGDPRGSNSEGMKISGSSKHSDEGSPGGGGLDEGESEGFIDGGWSGGGEEGGVGVGAEGKGMSS